MLAEPLTLERVRSLLADVRSDRLLDLHEAAKYLEIQPDELQHWGEEDLIPCEHVGGQLIFRLREIVRWEVEGRLRLRDSKGSQRNAQ